MGDLAFSGLAIMTIVSAFWVVVSTNLVRSAVALLFTLFGLAGFYIFLFADFIAAAQVIIYVGGILVLIIFGVMVTNKIDDPEVGSSSRNQLFASFGAVFILSILLTVIMRTEWKIGNITQADETIRKIGSHLMNDFVLPFELVSVLLLAALIGAAYLSRKDS
ncbi:MAG: NADH-quinone oxidoreductase subunit J [Candidatus Marinimicrobia bacterium]|nr:NADH-quinone oxidoreductase subunit J [Candidatus Neomarinimicrobiota bacterium]